MNRTGHAKNLAEATKQRQDFQKTFGGSYPKAVEVFEKDWE